ncbi:unnamed protein product [Didymodactylos carnosus]|uniref:BolA-like protein n=1 Tax=Didymodactylos carnosus TaxID=1234261 RepID=A0A813X2Z2_9BILA|nr:unnamed protein product [Didymodactylos carnosus]CAF0863772.1 unnamed protein product [Didymodactylos carnosus]CAF3530599.1 unnamed protein product [Didymodactylos carnosus]CAF3651325.1 unnamed protein product [Didymodactylos carnosus]
MDITKDNIEKKLRDEFEPTYLEIEDISGGCGLKFDATIVSYKFQKVTLLNRQRMVNDVLKADMPKIHAFSQHTYTPEEWEKKQSTSTPAATDTSVKACSNCDK